MITYIVIDTSYWLEMFKVPDHYKEENHLKIKALFDQASKNKYRLFLPIPVLFELANHIAHVDNGNKRYELAKRFSNIVNKGVASNDVLFNIIPSIAFSVADELDNSLSYFVRRFESEFVKQGLGFTDSSIILEAQQLKKDINAVHIWTLDNALKAREPDVEADAFTG